MYVAIDIGNTSITFALIKGKRIVAQEQFETVTQNTILKAKIRKRIRSWQRMNGEISGAILCSVVPKVLKLVEATLKREVGARVIVVGRHVKVPIINRYARPEQVGQDRLVCAYAAVRLYGYPVIVIDLGTAITFDVVSHKQEYLGGIIVPGIRLSVDALYQKAALLPRIRISQPRSLIGKDTEGSILSGIFYGYGTMIQGIIRFIRKKIQGRPQVVVTGGYTHMMKRYIAKQNSKIDCTLVLKGLALLYCDINEG